MWDMLILSKKNCRPNLSSTSQSWIIQVRFQWAENCETIVNFLLYAAITEDYHPPVLFNYNNSVGETMYGMYYKPHDHEEGQKHPTVLFVYGGPKVQLVTNSYKGMR